jgi:hypothetical protein
VGRLTRLCLVDGGAGQIGFELADQARVAGEAEDIVDPVRLAPGHKLLAGEARVRAQQDPDPRPRRADPIDDAGHLGHGAGRGVDVRGPQHRREQMPTAEHVQRQIAVAAVVAVKEPALLLTMQGVVRGIEVEDDLLGRPRVRLQKRSTNRWASAAGS